MGAAISKGTVYRFLSETQGEGGEIAEFFYCDIIMKVIANEQVGNDFKNIKEKWKEYIEILCIRDINIQDTLEDILYKNF